MQVARLQRPPVGYFTLNRESPQARGLVAWWPTLGSRGTNVLRDMAGSTLGTFGAGATRPTWARDGVHGAVLSCDGGDAVEMATPSAAIPIGDEAYSIAAWFNTTAMLRAGIIGWGNYGVNFQVNALRLNAAGGGEIIHYWWFSDLIVVVGDISGAWHHVAVTYDGTNRVMYLDGVVIGGDIPGVAHAVPNTANFTIAETWPASDVEHWDGELGDIRVANVAWTPAEVWHMYANPWDLYKTPGLPWAQRTGVPFPIFPPQGIHSAVFGGQVMR